MYPMSDPLTAGESEAAGKAARKRTPRSALGDWEAASDRTDPVEILVGQDKTRDNPNQFDNLKMRQFENEII
jgi:hypothetical protein